MLEKNFHRKCLWNKLLTDVLIYVNNFFLIGIYSGSPLELQSFAYNIYSHLEQLNTRGCFRIGYPSFLASTQPLRLLFFIVFLNFALSMIYSWNWLHACVWQSNFDSLSTSSWIRYLNSGVSETTICSLGDILCTKCSCLHNSTKVKLSWRRCGSLIIALKRFSGWL